MNLLLRKLSYKNNPSLSLTKDERNRLRRAKIRLADLSSLTVDSLNKATGMKLSRCKEIIESSVFQSLGSVGHLMAQKIRLLGYSSLSELSEANPYEMYERFCHIAGCRVDPCVEDVFRCAVAQAKYPDMPEDLKQWWMWTDKRGESEVYIQKE